MVPRSPARRPRRAPRLRRAVGALLALLTLGACQLRTELNIQVDPDGGGRVEFAVALDDDAVARRPDLVEALDLSDLADTGWEVTGPAVESDGFTWLRARHDFGAPEELTVLVDEIAGDGGPFRDFRLERDDAFAESEYRFSGTVDFAQGLDGVTDDPELAEALGAAPRELLEERLGQAIDELIGVQVAVRLPGEVQSNAPTRASNGAIWRPSVLERESVQLAATGTVSRSERLVWAAVAGVAGFALVLFVLIRVVLWRRRRARGDDPDDGATGVDASSTEASAGS